MPRGEKRQRGGAGEMALPVARRRGAFFVAAFVSVVTFIAYLPSLHNGFVDWDDGTYVTGNPFIRSLDAGLLKRAFLGFYANNWHPLTWLSHALDYAVWGTDAAGHHLTNVVLHSINAFLVVLVMVRLLGMKGMGSDGTGENRRLTAAVITGLLFGLHPLHVESVVWVSERKDLLCGLFFLSGILSYVRAAGVGTRPCRSLSLPFFFFILAAMSKPMAVTFPIVLIILDWHPLGRITSWRTASSALLEKLPFFAVSAAVSVLTVYAQGAAIRSVTAMPPLTRIAVAMQSIVLYLGKILWPLDLVPFYPYPKHVDFLSVGYLLPLVVVVGITLFCFAAVGKWKVFLAVWAYYLITLLPVLGIIQAGDQSMADRYMYLPGIGPFLLIGLTVSALIVRRNASPARRLLRNAVVGGTICVMGALAALTWNRTTIWKDSISLWSYVIDHGDGVAFAFNNRGTALYQEGHYQEAIGDLSRAIKLDPSDASYYNNRGTLHMAAKEFDKALADYRRAAELEPRGSSAFYNLACLYSARGDVEKACAYLKESLENGYEDLKHIREDRDLDPIRSAECYRTLMKNR